MTDPERTIHRWFEDLFNEGNLDAADELIHEDIGYHGPRSLSPRDVDGVEDVKRYAEVYREAFPDLEYTVDHVFRAGDELCARWTVEGTHRSDLFGIEATGETFEAEGINVFHVEDGRITEVWSAWDTLEMAQELDVVPTIELLAD